ncbi:hypothetical protein [Novosphingobium sp. PP1Y]|uniref:hypothetical protein n=1 Tax=Novosphingobium sp. PP1Y TaxID=702113 RepID=UPI00020EE736|nr:hypothetical protein [Novosphingobium sp. PP1Y]CCA91119.1 conserved hypothetical protein [Novosphingobium sp. PP1Y]
MTELLYRGFDGLDVSFQGQISTKFAEALDNAKTQAGKSHQREPLEWNGILLAVFETGAKGGYAFSATTGEFGATWFFKRPSIHDPWGVRVSCSSFLLATKGLGGARAYIYAVMGALDIALQPNAESIGRVDYALDYLLPGFTLTPEHFVMHSNARRADHHEIHEIGVNGRSGRVTSVTVGKMPGRQLIVYDKRAEIVAKRKTAWWDIWDATRSKEGRPTLVRDCPADSPVWRVEIRAGKQHLKTRWRISSWRDLDNRFGDTVTGSLNAIRYATPTDDSNRSRWPEASLWQAVRQEISDDLFEMRNFADPDLTKSVQRDEHDKMLKQQMAGLLTTRAALHGLDTDKLREFAEFCGKEMALEIDKAPPHFAKKLAKAVSRFRTIY